MAEPDKMKVTQILSAASRGDEEAAQKLWSYVYEELRRLASKKLAATPPGQMLQPTALVHEAYIRLIGDQDKEAQWDSRAHFFGAAARAMRNVVVDQARRQGRIKRGGDRKQVPISQVVPAFAEQTLDLLALDEALARLEARDPRTAEVAMLRFFAGLTIDETAKTLDISTSTVEREWSYARAWLHREINKGDPEPD